MPSIVDELVIKISMDMSALKAQGTAVEKQLHDIREGAETTGKRMEESGKRASQFFAAAKIEAISLMAVLTGGAGLLTVLNSTAAGLAAFGRNAINLNNMDPSRLDAWGQALKRIGGNADDAFTSFNNIGRAIAEFTLLGSSSKAFPFMNAIGGQRTDTPEQIAMKFSAYIKAHPEKSAQEINVLGSGIGLTQPMINLLRQGPAGVNKELEESTRLGLVTKQMVETAAAFQAAFAKLEQATGNLKDKFEVALMPTMQRFVDQITGWIKDNPDLPNQLATKLSKALEEEVEADIAFFNSAGEAFKRITDSAVSLWHAFEDFTAWLNSLNPFHKSSTPSAGSPAAPGSRLAGPRAGGGEAQPGIPYQAGDVLRSTGATSAQYDAFRNAVGGIEHFKGDPNDPMGYSHMGGSSNRFAGRYQMGADEIRETARRLFEKPPTRAEFLANPAMQERYFEAYTQGHHEQLMRTSAAYRAMSPAERLAVLGYAHNQGAGGAGEWLRTGQVGRDAFNTGGDAYVKAVQRALANSQAKTAPNGVPRTGPVFGPVITPIPPNSAAPHLLSHESYLLPPPGQRGENELYRGSSNDNRIDLDIGAITIQTQATNAHGIAKELHGAISDRLIRSSNRGLA